MREIKFKAWDKKEKVMHIAKTLTKLIATHGDIMYIVDRFGIRGDIVPENGYRHFIWLEYTGLKDKTKWEDATGEQKESYTKETWGGVEIYEGDIVKIIDQALEEFRGKVVSVVFEMGAFRDSYYKWNLSGKSHTFEVIGNIYENPELLKEGDNAKD